MLWLLLSSSQNKCIFSSEAEELKRAQDILREKEAQMKEEEEKEETLTPDPTLDSASHEGVNDAMSKLEKLLTDTLNKGLQDMDGDGEDDSKYSIISVCYLSTLLSFFYLLGLLSMYFVSMLLTILCLLLFYYSVFSLNTVSSLLSILRLLGLLACLFSVCSLDFFLLSRLYHLFYVYSVGTVLL